MRKRITSLLLTLAMLLSLLPAMGVTASAAEPEWTTVSTYEELRNEVNKGSAKIKLTADIDTTSENSGVGVTTATNLRFKGNGNVLDLNGHELKLVSNMSVYFIEIDSSDLTIKDSDTNGNGRIEFIYGDSVVGVQRAIVIGYSLGIKKPGSLTVDGGTLSSSYHGIILIESFGSITINGGRLYAPVTDLGNADDIIHSTHSYDPDGTFQLHVNGGELDGRVVLQRDDSTATGTLKYKVTPIKITGGTFKQGLYATWGMGDKPEGAPKNAEMTMDSPTVEITGGVFEKNNEEYGLSKSFIRIELPTKLRGGTFKNGARIRFMGKEYTSTANATRLYYPASIGNSAILCGDEVRMAYNWSDSKCFELRTPLIFLYPKVGNPVTVIPNAWGMKSVTLDGNPIDYFKDWNGTVERMDNSTAHTLKFEWKPLAQELKDAGYSYRVECDRYISGNKTPTTDKNLTGTEYSFTIPAGADPKVYSFDLHLNLKKGDNNIGIISNEHIVKLVVNEAPVIIPDPTIEGNVYYTSGIVYGRSISTGTGNLPADLDSGKLRYQWQRSTNGGDWENIDGETRGSYTPGAADMGENVRIRVVVTAEGYLGEIVGAPVTVSKAANNNYPEVIQLEAVKNDGGAYTGFGITNFDPNCEYVYSTTSTPDWSANQISSDTVTGLTSNTTYYVFARFKETATQTAGSIVSKNSIMLYDYVPLQYVLLEGYDSGNTIYIKKGESVTLKVSADPSNANSWKEITFKDSSNTTPSNIDISDGTINASGTTATAFPNDHSITIKGVSAGSATLDASYSGTGDSRYSRWYVTVYDDSHVADALRLENVYTYEDITLTVNDTAELPTELPKLLPENSGYHLEWRIVKVGSGGASYKTSDDNIELVDGKIIKPKAAHATSEKTSLELVAVKDNSTTYKSFSSRTSRFNVTVTAAPVIELTGLTVAPTKVNLAKVGDTCQLSAVKEPVNAEGSSLTWASDKPDIATVSSTGEVKAVAAGTATITVTCGSKSATCTVTVAHTHDTDGRDWMYMDPGTHIKTCTAGDDFKVQAHTFSAWTDNGNDTHSHHCTVCKMADGSTYTETASHNWQWVVDTPATSTTAGKQHEECPDCHATRNEGTVIPATGGGSSSGGGGGGGAGVTTYAITVQNSKNGTVTASHKSAAKDTAVTLTVTPDKGYVLDTLTVLDSKDKAVKLTEKNGKFTFTMPAGKVTVSAAFKATAPASENPFTDVPSGAYYEDAVIWAVKKGITSGTSATTFNPDGSCTRAQAVTFLWRAAGSPEPKSAAMPFTDVPAGSYFEKAVLWAVENGITKGTSDTTFSPDASCTRAQIVTFLWRAGGSPAVSGNSAFSDVASDVYYAAAVAWAEKNGVTGGIGGGLFGSDNTCTRAQIVTFLYRAMK